MVWSNFTEPLERGRLPGKDWASGEFAVFPWQSNKGLWPRGSRDYQGLQAVLWRGAMSSPVKGFTPSPHALQLLCLRPGCGLTPSIWSQLLAPRMHGSWHGSRAAECPQGNFYIRVQLEYMFSCGLFHGGHLWICPTPQPHIQWTRTQRCYILGNTMIFFPTKISLNHLEYVYKTYLIFQFCRSEI